MCYVNTVLELIPILQCYTVICHLGSLFCLYLPCTLNIQLLFTDACSNAGLVSSFLVFPS